MKNWLFTIIISALVWGIGIGGYVYISNSIPNQLVVSSAFIEDPTETNYFNEETLDTKTVIHNSQKLVVMIVADSIGSVGSGFLYNNSGDIITNAHVVSGTEQVKIRMTDAREYEGRVIGISLDTDVAVIRVPDLAGVDPLPVASDRYAEIGDEVLALGSPLGLQNTVTTGIISGVDRSFEIGPYVYDNVYQTSAPIAPGNSGGPLVDLASGEVIGINSAGADQGAIGFSIPIQDVLPMIDGWSVSPMNTLPNIHDNYYMASGYDQIADDVYIASYIIEYFYDSINYNDYVTAYSLLGHNWQGNTNYEKFREGYINTRYVTMDDLQARVDGDYVSVVGVISAAENRNGSTVVSKYKVTYQIGYENDQIKIISGNGEKIN